MCRSKVRNLTIFMSGREAKQTGQGVALPRREGIPNRSTRLRQVAAPAAVLGDERIAWRPAVFDYGLWRCELRFRFPAVKLLDYRRAWAALEASRNPFATVVMAQLTAQETRQECGAAHTSEVDIHAPVV
jgi:hypothetical protein